MSKLLFLLLALALLVVSCNYKNDTKNINNRTILVSTSNASQISEINTNVSFIPLETSEESRLGHIYNLEITDDYIYMLDRQTFFVFSKEGDFIKKLPRGKGPGELTRALNFSFNKYKNEIYIIETGRILHIYNELAEYKETHVLDGSFIDVKGLNNDLLLLYSSLPEKWGKYLISVYNTKTQMFVGEYIPMKELFTPNLDMLTYNHFIEKNNMVYISGMNTRKVYEYSNDSISVVYDIDFGSLNPPASFISKYEYDEAGTFKRDTYENNYIGFLYYCYLINDYTILGLDYRDNNCGIINKDENTIHLTTISNLFGLPETPSFKWPINANDNKLFFVYYNDLFLENNIPEGEYNLEIGDNSIVIKEHSNPTIVCVSIIE